MNPDADTILLFFSPETWLMAAGQILFSLSPCTGAAVALASFNEKDYQHLFADAVIIAITNSGFSIFSGFLVFSVIGHMAHTYETTVSEL